MYVYEAVICRDLRRTAAWKRSPLKSSGYLSVSIVKSLAITCQLRLSEMSLSFEICMVAIEVNYLMHDERRVKHWTNEIYHT